MDDFTPLERAVMDSLLDGDDPVLVALRAQWKAATLADRRYSGVGFFTDFYVPIDLQVPPGDLSLTVRGVRAELGGLEHGADFVLFVGAGFIQTLEGWTPDDRWPDELGAFSLIDD